MCCRGLRPWGRQKGSKFSPARFARRPTITKDPLPSSPNYGSIILKKPCNNESRKRWTRQVVGPRKRSDFHPTPKDFLKDFTLCGFAVFGHLSGGPLVGGPPPVLRCGLRKKSNFYPTPKSRFRAGGRTPPSRGLGLETHLSES